MVSVQGCCAFGFEQGDLVERQKEPTISTNWVYHLKIVRDTLEVYLLIACASESVNICLFFLRFLRRFLAFLSFSLSIDTLFFTLGCFDSVFALLNIKVEYVTICNVEDKGLGFQTKFSHPLE